MVLVCSLALAALFLFEDSVADYYFGLLEPWQDLCANITPEEWQVEDNILLGFLWLLTGVVAYSMLMGLCCVILLAFAQASRHSLMSPCLASLSLHSDSNCRMRQGASCAGKPRNTHLQPLPTHTVRRRSRSSVNDQYLDHSSRP